MRSWIFEEWTGREVPRSSDSRSQILEYTHFWLDPMGLARRAGTVALLTSFVGKEPHLRHWLITLLSTLNGFLTEVFLSRKANAWKSVALLPSLFIIFPWATEQIEVTDLRQMAYQAGNPWLWPKLVGSHSLWAL